MPQFSMPIFSSDVTLINGLIGVTTRDDIVYYFNGQMPLFQHEKSDKNSFKMYMSQLYCCGNATQAELINTFALSESSIKRWVKKYRTGGAKAFFTPPPTRSVAVLTPAKLEEIQNLLNESDDITEIAIQCNVKRDTLLKAIQTRKLIRVKKTQRLK